MRERDPDAPAAEDKPRVESPVARHVEAGRDVFIADRDLFITNNHCGTNPVGIKPGTGSQFREDLLILLNELDKEARELRLPAYLPKNSDVSTLARSVRARHGIRQHIPQELTTEARRRNLDDGMEKYLPFNEKVQISEPPRAWEAVARDYRRVVVLADPGFGKSWLIRTETRRLCREALERNDRGEDITSLLIPIPVRCDQLIGRGESIAEASAEYLVAEKLLPARSRSHLQGMVEDGRVVLLLDALDELITSEDHKRFRELVRRWQQEVQDEARCVVTSRIAGYRGSPITDAREVELLGLSPDEVTSAIDAWNLPPSAKALMFSSIKHPAVAGMTRIPLLLALLCSLAAELPAGQRLPETRVELYEQVLRSFLKAAHRAEERRAQSVLSAERVDDLLDILAPVAFHFATYPIGWVDLMAGDELRSAIRAAGPAFDERRSSAVEMVEELSIRAGILVPAGNPSAGRRPDYLFLHRAFYEYLVARHLAKLDEPTQHRTIDDHLWFDPDWTEVLPLLGGLLERKPASAFIKRLLDEVDDPFNYALITALRALAERPDADALLPPADLRAMSGRVLALVDHPDTRAMITELLASAPKVSQHITEGLLAKLGNADLHIRTAAASGLAPRMSAPVTAALISRLDDAAAGVREASAAALAYRYDRHVTYALLEHLHDHDYLHSWAVAKALAGRRLPEVTRELVAYSARALPHVRVAIIRTLTDHAEPEVTNMLVTSLGSDSGAVRMAAAKALMRRDPESMSRLLSCAESPDRWVRETVVNTIAGHKDPTVIAVLLGRLSDTDRLVWSAAVAALATYDSPQVTPALLARIAVTDSDIPEAMVLALARRRAPAVTDALLALLRNPKPTLHRALINSLAYHRTPVVTSALLAQLEVPNGLIRLHAVWALGRRDVPETTQRLLGCLNDEESSVRQAAAEALAWRDEADVTPSLLKCLADSDFHVCMSAIRAVATRPGTDVTDSLLGCLQSGSAPVRVAAIEALAGRTGTAVSDALLIQLDDDHRLVRSAAARALASHDSTAVTRALVDKLNDLDHIVRQAAVRALANRRQPAVTEALLDRLKDVDWDVREAALSALQNRDLPVVINTLLGHLNADSPMAASAAAIIAMRDVPSDLVALSGQVEKLPPAALRNAYMLALRIIGHTYSRIPAESRPAVRSSLAWLTRAVLRKPEA